MKATEKKRAYLRSVRPNRFTSSPDPLLNHNFKIHPSIPLLRQTLTAGEEVGARDDTDTNQHGSHFFCELPIDKISISAEKDLRATSVVRDAPSETSMDNP